MPASVFQHPVAAFDGECSPRGSPFHTLATCGSSIKASSVSANLDEARIEAVRHAGEFLRDRPSLAWTSEELRIEGTDPKQLVLFTVLVVGIDAPAGGRSLKPAF